MADRPSFAILVYLVVDTSVDPPQYLCPRGEFCSNENHAARFDSRVNAYHASCASARPALAVEARYWSPDV